MIINALNTNSLRICLIGHIDITFDLLLIDDQTQRRKRGVVLTPSGWQCEVRNIDL
jgi:hypothetical protein